MESADTYHMAKGPQNKCVFVTLVMLNDEYVPGAAVLAKSLRNVGTKYPIWAMVDSHVSMDALVFLSDGENKLFDRIIIVPTIEHEVINMRSKKQNDIYGRWISKSFTKWNIFNPDIFQSDGVPLEKVFFLDADIMVTENIDNIFDLDPPAATFSSPWAKPYSAREKTVPTIRSTDPAAIQRGFILKTLKNGFVKKIWVSADGKPMTFIDRSGGIYNPYLDRNMMGPRHGEIIPQYQVHKGLNSIVGIGSAVLVKPSVRSWQIFLNLLHARDVYGWSECFSGFDEQILAEIFLGLKVKIRHISPRYNWFVGKWDWLTHEESGLKPATYHFYNLKPWQQPRDAWVETIEWWKVADQVMLEHPESEQWFTITPRERSASF